METYRELTTEEEVTLKKALQEDMDFMKKVLIGAVLFGLVGPFVPLGLHRRARRSGISGNLIDNNGPIEAFIMTFIVSAIFVALFYYVILTPHKLKKDLNERKVVIAEVDVRRLERLSPKLSAMMENGEDSILHFRSNKYKVKKFYFSSQRRPELLSAKKMRIERAVHSQKEFVSEII